MAARTRTLRRLLGLPLATLLVAVGVVVPIMDAGLGARGPVLESEHHASSCVIGHDHSICTQVGANLAMDAGSAARAVPDAACVFLPPGSSTACHGRESAAGHRSRAPPLVRA